MKIQILVDNPESWIIPYSNQLFNDLKNLGHSVSCIYSHSEVVSGDILFLLSCTKIFKQLNLNKYNLVIHESDLPEGKGWSPVSWKILEGKSKIPIVLFEAVENVDAGPIFIKDYLIFEGHELINEIRKIQGEKTIKLALQFVSTINDIACHEQKGESSFYPRRTPKDSELDINKSIKEQFNLFRIVDNEKYPAFFVYKDHKYLLKIYKDNETN